MVKTTLKILPTILLLFIIIYGFYSTFKIRVINAQDEIINEDIYEFHPAIEQFIHKLDDDFLIPIIVKSKSNVVILEYESDEFFITQNPYISNGNVIIDIKYNGYKTNPIVMLRKTNIERSDIK